MELTEKMIDIITHAEGKALATAVPGCLHVVPVSTIKIVEDKIESIIDEEITMKKKQVVDIATTLIIVKPFWQAAQAMDDILNLMKKEYKK